MQSLPDDPAVGPNLKEGAAVITGFALDVTECDVDAVLRLTGELDMATAPQLRRELLGLIERGVRSVTVDLAKLDFIDSSGLNVLVSGLKQFREHGGELTVRSPSPSAKKVFEITGLTQIFAIT